MFGISLMLCESMSRSLDVGVSICKVSEALYSTSPFGQIHPMRTMAVTACIYPHHPSHEKRAWRGKSWGGTVQIVQRRSSVHSQSIHPSVSGGLQPFCSQPISIPYPSHAFPLSPLGSSHSHRTLDARTLGQVLVMLPATSRLAGLGKRCERFLILPLSEPKR